MFDEEFYFNVELMDRNAKVPTRAHDTDAGLDFYTPKSFTIVPRADVCIGLKIRTEFPKGYALIFVEKSGIATKKKIDIGAKCIDSGYSGEVHAHLINNSDKKVVFNRGDKVVQGLIIPVWNGQPEVVEEIDMKTDRSESGFGSTDINTEPDAKKSEFEKADSIIKSIFKDNDKNTDK